jgi:hypothetical protein
LEWAQKDPSIRNYQSSTQVSRLGGQPNHHTSSFAGYKALTMPQIPAFSGNPYIVTSATSTSTAGSAKDLLAEFDAGVRRVTGWVLAS